MDFLLQISPLTKLIIVFIFIVVLIKKRLSLGVALVIGTVLLGLWFKLSPLQIGSSIFRSILAERTVILCIIVTLILILSHSMDKTGQMKRLLDSFRGISYNIRLNLALFPLLIGLLPMPGGAIFSAPMVDEIGDQESISAEQKTVINYWFRHIWEFCWPLYPGVILTCALSGITFLTFVVVQIPLTIFAFLIGYLVHLRPIMNRKDNPSCASRKGLKGFLVEVFPILLVVGGSGFFSGLLSVVCMVWSPAGLLPKEFSLITALITGVLWVWWWNHVTFADIRQIFFNRSLLSMVFMILGVMVFQGILNDSQAVSEISQSLTSYRVPFILVVTILPFLVGNIVGITVAFVGTTF
ncbi:MAG: DUF401 family protein, partial [Thermodesulfobacteriota bacterium]|nr:DUF401 family protein [Thermodesulfobacteriota bacterium]